MLQARGTVARAGRSRVHAPLVEVELALEGAQHVVVDRALGPQSQQRLSLGVDDPAPDFAMLDELTILAVTVRAVPLVIDVFRPVLIRVAQTIEERAMPWPHRVQLIDLARRGLE